MDEMIRYIFWNMRSSENAVKRIKTVALFASVTTVYIILTETRLRKQNKKLEKLRNEIKELKRMKGE